MPSLLFVKFKEDFNKIYEAWCGLIKYKGFTKTSRIKELINKDLKELEVQK